MSAPLNVLFLSPEMVPFAKTGGLADVAGSLPPALKRLGLDVRIVLPFYRSVREKDFERKALIDDLEVPLGKAKLKADVLESATTDRVPVYLIDREDMYDRPNLYGTASGDYYDNLERFTFFVQGALRLTESLPFIPDVIHCHDWQTGLVPAMIKGLHTGTSLLEDASTIFTIHNIGYPGIFPEERFFVTGLSKGDFFHPTGMEYWGNISLLKAGIEYADAITTVSPKYADEIRTPEYGMGMDGVLQRRRQYLHGILNGIDYGLWDPARDKHLADTYSQENLSGKSECKESLIREMKLDPSFKNRPLLGMISRLDAQKGLDLLVEILDQILNLDVGLVILGSGQEDIQTAIERTARKHRGRVGLYIGFNEPLAHRIIAGADIFLIPSKYEPCGLTQMYALKYGTVPVVRATGGLDDTIVSFDSETFEGNGFKFKPYKAGALLSAIREAVDLYGDVKAWKRLMENGMNADFSWDRSARKYLELYESVARGKK